jgi:acyl-CoA reductase-like NAD-dependent aldehyde dehydrogenase
MHPALLIALMEERERELARRNRHAWKRPPAPKRERLLRRGGSRIRHAATAFARSLAFFS